MLKIGIVKWRGKCSKHPGYDPDQGGAAAVKGNCLKCNELAEIFECQQKMLRLMRNFQPVEDKKKKRAAAAVAAFNELQQSLF